jgi:hypothetical protein
LCDEAGEDWIMRISKNHLGVSFEVWNAQQTWFWFVANTNRSGMIGAAATESDAIGDARSSIEEITDSSVRKCWEASLGNLARYLDCVCNAPA